MKETVYENCPHCGYENEVAVEPDKPIPRRVVCAKCGKRILLCSMCDANCNWDRETDTCSWETNPTKPAKEKQERKKAMKKQEMMKTLYSAVADEKAIEPSALWDCVSKHLKSAPKNDHEFNEVWSEIVALTNELAVNAFTAGFNAAMEITRG